ncbi:MAG: pirin family protein [Acidobacteriales bacterium]|nr:pirin family protein [Terriglobales bacterium]
MITIRKSEDRGHAEHGWLFARHTFSFANYFDRAHTHFRTLRVINEDVVQPGQGFGRHSHNDMEILTYILEGALEHKDSMGNKGAIRPGDVQRMSAGSGVEHSEFNHSQSEPVHLLQIWLFPERKGIEPGYEQKHFPAEERRGKLALVAAREPRDGSLTIHQDAAVFASLLGPGQSVSHTLASGRGAYLQLARGSVTVNGQTLKAGDGAAIEKETELKIAQAGADEAEFLLFDLA